MYEFECLTNLEIDVQKINNKVEMENCSPFLGGCYPEAEDCCGPDCSPN